MSQEFEKGHSPSYYALLRCTTSRSAYQFSAVRAEAMPPGLRLPHRSFTGLPARQDLLPGRARTQRRFGTPDAPGNQSSLQGKSAPLRMSGPALWPGASRWMTAVDSRVDGTPTHASAKGRVQGRVIVSEYHYGQNPARSTAETTGIARPPE